jgi:nucleoside diphosphate kinase
VPLPENPSDFIDEVLSAMKAKGMKIIDQHEKICSEELARAHYEEFVDVFSSDF